MVIPSVQDADIHRLQAPGHLLMIAQGVVLSIPSGQDFLPLS